MKKNKLDNIWDKIADDLSLNYKESNREALSKAIQELPKYKAPAKVWINIENQLKTKAKVEKLPNMYLLAASLALLIGLSIFVYNASNKNKIQYARGTSINNNLYEIADTSSSCFNKILNSTCSIKPNYCASNEFKSFEKEYQTLEIMQQKILKQAAHYDNDDELESMLLKIENQKKNIEQRLIEQINS
jgi:hypothetical protein